MDQPGPGDTAPPAPLHVSSGLPEYTHTGVRYRLGYVAGQGQDYYAIWNLSTGVGQRFPLTDPGWVDAWRTFTGLEPNASPVVGGWGIPPPAPPPPRTAGIREPVEVPAAPVCRVCGRAPAALFTFRANVGMLLMRQQSRFMGLLCKDCAKGVFRAFQGKTLVLGWWGVLSFFANFGYVIGNANQVRGARSLGPPMPAVDPEAERRLRGRSLLRNPIVLIAGPLALALLAGLVIWQTGLTRPGAPLNHTLLHDDFSQPGNWQVTNNADMTMGSVNGQYQIDVHTPKYKGGSIRYLPGSEFGGITVSADVHKTTPTTPTGLFGVECVGAAGRGYEYEFLIDPDNDFYQIFERHGSKHATLKQGTESPASGVILAGDSVNHVSGTCVRSETSTTVTLTMAVNGHVVAVATDPIGLPSFYGIGLVVISLKSPTSGRFDNALMRRL